MRPVDICCDSACAPGALRRTPTLRSAYVSLHTRLGAGPSRLARVCGRVGISSVSLCQYERCAPNAHVSLRIWQSPLVGIVVACRPHGLPSTPFLLRKTAPFLCHRQRSQFCPCTHGSALVPHALLVCAAGRHLLRLSMCARRFAPNAHASLRICLPAHTARRWFLCTLMLPRMR